MKIRAPLIEIVVRYLEYHAVPEAYEQAYDQRQKGYRKQQQRRPAELTLVSAAENRVQQADERAKREKIALQHAEHNMYECSRYALDYDSEYIYRHNAHIADNNRPEKTLSYLRKSAAFYVVEQYNEKQQYCEYIDIELSVH
jgi:hypothetical protein